MIKLFKVKEKQRELAENASGGAPVKKQSAGELRLHKGLLLLIELIFCVFFILSSLCGTSPLPMIKKNCKAELHGNKEK